MPEIKWIKITTTMFEDEKIDFIDSLPDKDTILILWIKLLALAGMVNDQGLIYLTPEIPYTEDMLAHKFKRPINTVKLAIETFKRLGMITLFENGLLGISNWEKHQNIEKMQLIREQGKKRVQKFRQKQKVIGCNAFCNTDVTQQNKNKIKNKEKEEEEEKEKQLLTEPLENEESRKNPSEVNLSNSLSGKKKGSKLSDDEWIVMLQSNIAYQGINIAIVQAKLEAWCITNGKKPTRKRLLNWLNREEKPLQSKSHSSEATHDITGRRLEYVT